jgi:predicted O-methyltransferase YrrM
MAGHNVWSVQSWLGYLFEDEVIEMQRFARELLELGDPVVINIGAGGGTSGILFMEIFKDKGYLYTIDVQDESSPFGCLEGERAVFESAGLDHLAGKHWFQIHGDSKEVGKSWEGPKVDFVFVDGDHSYEGCVGDILMWWPHLKENGLIAIHDYGKGDIDFQSKQKQGQVVPHPKSYPNVDQAVEDYLLNSEQVEQVSRVESLITFRKIDGSPLEKSS